MHFVYKFSDDFMYGLLYCRNRQSLLYCELNRNYLPIVRVYLFMYVMLLFVFSSYHPIIGRGIIRYIYVQTMQSTLILITQTVICRTVTTQRCTDIYLCVSERRIYKNLFFEFKPVCGDISVFGCLTRLLLNKKDSVSVLYFFI